MPHIHSGNTNLLRILLVLGFAGICGRASAQPLATIDLCGPPGAGSIGKNWVSLPYRTDMRTAEDLCLSIPGALSVAQGASDATPETSRRWEYDCATGICTSGQPIPEPGCLASACFCIDPGDGIEVVPAAATPWDVNRCDTFETVNLPPGFQNYLVSIPYSTFLVTANDLAAWVGLPNSGPLSSRGSILRLNCATGASTVCQAGTATCDTMLIEPGRAYRVRWVTSTLGVSFTNPTACTPIPVPAPATCPIDGPTFIDADTLTWIPPVGCPLPLVYDVIRGDLGCLRGFCTQSIAPLSYSCAGCEAIEDNGGTDTLAVDLPGTPPLGTGYWYRVRVDGGTWNPPSVPAQCSDWDAMLSPGGCP